MEVNPFGQGQPINFETYKSERARLDSFSQPPGWPIPYIPPEACSYAGFFFLRDGDKVKCAFCRGVVGDWEPGDNPMTEHQRHYPRCPFICGFPVGNIPLDDEVVGAAVSGSQDEAVGMDVCGPYAPDLSQLLAFDPPAPVSEAQPLMENEVVTSLGIKTRGHGPAHRGLVTLPSRIKTFTNWPMESGQTPDKMAEAGFFYIGRRDHVKCFYCDGGLGNWEATDDPWREHARCFPNCAYVILNNRNGFVEEVNGVNPPIQFQQQPPRTVSDQELRDLCDTPIVREALDMGMELGRVRSALKRRIQQTGQPFLTTEDLLEAVLGRDPEYESDSDSDTDNIDEENLSPAPRQRPPRPNTASSTNVSFNNVGSGSSAEATSSSSAGHSDGSGDEETVSSAVQPSSNVKSTTGSDDGGVRSATPQCSSCEEDEPAQIDKVADMEEEVRELREKILCKICMDNQVGIVFLPCGHLISCARCATALSNCALCRQPIKALVRTYLA